MTNSGITLGLFGRRKTGKTNLLAALGGRGEVPAEPSEVLETSVRLPEFGKVALLAPAGLDDERALGVDAERTKELLGRLDLAIIVVDVVQGWSDYEKFLLSKVRVAGYPAVAVINREQGEDICETATLLARYDVPSVAMDLSTDKADARDLLSLVSSALRITRGATSLIEGLLGEGQSVWLVVANNRPGLSEPIGPAEVGLAKDVLGVGGTISIVKEADLESCWAARKTQPDLIVADATVLKTIVDQIPEDQPVTSLAILVSRQRGELEAFVRGVKAIDSLQAGDRVLISEACMLHVQPDDIARMEIPNLLRAWVGADLEFSTSSGGEMYDGISDYALVVRCGACMLDRESALRNLASAERQNGHVTNYGIATAYMHGLMERMLRPVLAAGELAAFSAADLAPPRAIPPAEHDAVTKPPSM